jgi:uncharacterized RDD family membrane protein YckC
MSEDATRQSQQRQRNGRSRKKKVIAAGWYKDPAAPETQRYWDGEQWLGQPIPADATPPDGPPPPLPPPPPKPAAAGWPGWPGGDPGAGQPGAAWPGQRGAPGVPWPGQRGVPGQPGVPGQGPQAAAGQHGGAGQQTAPGQQAAPGQHGGGPGQAGPSGRVSVFGPVMVLSQARPQLPAGFTAASLERRLGARIVDLLVVGVLSLIANSWLGYRALQIFLPYFREVLRNPEGQQPPMDSRLSSMFYVMVLISLALWFAYEVISTSRSGQTFGKKLFRIKVVRMDGQPVDSVSSFRRWAIMAIPNLFFPCCVPIQAIDALWCTWDRPLGQCIHDKSARTIVVSAAGTDTPEPGGQAAPSEPEDQG